MERASMTAAPAKLRPFLPTDTEMLREIFAASIEELTAEDYDENQRAAWASRAEDAAAFGALLAGMLTLVAHVDGEIVGFAALKDGKVLEMLYVHPYHAGEGIGGQLADALERIAAARAASALTVDASETSVEFFEGRGYIGQRRNSLPVDGEWLANTTMTKSLAPAARN
jgi:putative acetyltransferase